MSLVEGKWPITHLSEHKTMFDNLISLLADIEHSFNNDGTPIVLPRNEAGIIQWNEISVAFIIQWYMMNSNKITHVHKEEK